jgi:hypothetical protein
LIACCALVASAVAHAQAPSDADRLFEEGRALAKAGKWADACDHFGKSLALDRASGTEINLADCHEHQGQLREAWGMYVAAASDAEAEGNQKRRDIAREGSAKLEPRMTSIIVKVAQPALPGLVITISGRATPPAQEIHEHADPGPIDVIATAPNLPHFKKSEVGAAGATLVVEIPPLDHSIAPEPPKPAEIPRADVKLVPGDREPGRVHIAYGLAAGGLAAAIGGLTFTWVGRNHYNQVADGPNCDRVGSDIVCNDTGKQQVKDAQHLADYGTICAIGSALLFGGAAVVYFTSPHELVRVTPTATATSAGVSISGAF